jgi:hypothetical protein
LCRAPGLVTPVHDINKRARRVNKLAYARASYDNEEWTTLDVLRNETAARSVGQFSAHIAKSLCELPLCDTTP